jgi:hypothetical protein
MERLLQPDGLGLERRKTVNESGPEGSSYKRILLGASRVPGRSQLEQSLDVRQLVEGNLQRGVLKGTPFLFLPWTVGFLAW